MAYDQGVAPLGVGAGQAKIGELNIGIQGLIQLLETHLGMTGQDIHHAMRIQGYMQAMETLLDKKGAAFFKASFESDAWSSAKQMLDWRDELVDLEVRSCFVESESVNSFVYLPFHDLDEVG